MSEAQSLSTKIEAVNLVKDQVVGAKGGRWEVVELGGMRVRLTHEMGTKKQCQGVLEPGTELRFIEKVKAVQGQGLHFVDRDGEHYLMHINHLALPTAYNMERKGGNLVELKVKASKEQERLVSLLKIKDELIRMGMECPPTVLEEIVEVEEEIRVKKLEAAKAKLEAAKAELLQAEGSCTSTEKAEAEGKVT